MEFGLDVAQQRVEFDELVQRVRLAESLPFIGVWGFDHLVPMYGEGPGNCFEGMVTLAALSGLTSRIRLGLLVTSVTIRHPSLFASQAMTIDHASHGRLDIGLGVGWYEAEHTAFGIAFPAAGQRFDLLEDTLEITTRLFTGKVVSHSGRIHSLANARLNPMPVQQPRPPIWIGGSGPQRTLPLVAKFADVWHPGQTSNLGESVKMLEVYTEQLGRDPKSIARAYSLSISESWSEVRRALESRIADGYDYLICGWPEQGAQRVREFAETVLPDYI